MVERTDRSACWRTSTRGVEMAEEMCLRPVGIVRSAEQAAVIEIEPALHGILDGIEGFSHVLVLYWAHLNPHQDRPAVKVHPMGRKELPLTGVFATRSPVRPNPVLATVVRLVESTGDTLTVAGLDAVDGTPVIDIKPVTPGDCPAGEVRVAPWLADALHELEGPAQDPA